MTSFTQQYCCNYNTVSQEMLSNAEVCVDFTQRLRISIAILHA